MAAAMERNSPHLNMPLRRSPLLAAYIVISHFAALGALTMTALPGSLSALLAVLIALHFGFSWRRHWRRSFLIYDSCGWRYRDAERDWIMHPAGENVIWPWLLILNFRTDSGRRLSLVLPPDAAVRQDLRRLRILLRHITPTRYSQ